jgi:hypothetical protein
VQAIGQLPEDRTLPVEPSAGACWLDLTQPGTQPQCEVSRLRPHVAASRTSLQAGSDRGRPAGIELGARALTAAPTTQTTCSSRALIASSTSAKSPASTAAFFPCAVGRLTLGSTHRNRRGHNATTAAHQNKVNAESSPTIPHAMAKLPDAAEHPNPGSTASGPRNSRRDGACRQRSMASGHVGPLSSSRRCGAPPTVAG